MKKYSQDFTKIKDVERLLIDIGRILAHFKKGSDKEGLKLIDDARKKLHQYIVEDNLIEDDNGTIVHLLEAERAIEQVKKTHLETILSLIDFCEECNGTSSTVSLETPLRHGWIIETTVKKKE